MTELEQYQEFENELQTFAAKHAITRIKVSTINFDRDFKLGQDARLDLVSCKAIIRVLGKMTKVPIGPDEEHKTYEEAFEATKTYWSEYYKTVRAKRTPAERRAEAERQKRYREKRRGRETEAERRQ